MGLSKTKNSYGSTYKKGKHGNQHRKVKQSTMHHRDSDSTHQDFTEIELDLSTELKPVGSYIENRTEMIEHIFLAVKGNQLDSLLPDILKKLPIEELKKLCVDELEIMTKKRIRNILEGLEMTGSSSDSEQSESENEEEEECLSYGTESDHIGTSTSGSLDHQLPDSTTSSQILEYEPISPSSSVGDESESRDVTANDQQQIEGSQSNSVFDNSLIANQKIQSDIVPQRLSILTEPDEHEVALSEKTLRASDTVCYIPQVRHFRQKYSDPDEERIDLALSDDDDDCSYDFYNYTVLANPILQSSASNVTGIEVSSSGVSNKDQGNILPDSTEEHNPKDASGESASSSDVSDSEVLLDDRYSSNEDVEHSQPTVSSKNQWKHDKFSKRERIPTKQPVKFGRQYATRETKNWRWEHDDRSRDEERSDNEASYSKQKIKPKLDNAKHSGLHRPDPIHAPIVSKKRKRYRSNTSCSSSYCNIMSPQSSPNSVSSPESAERRVVYRDKKKFRQERKDLSDESEFEEIEIEQPGSDLEEGEIRTIKIKQKKHEENTPAIKSSSSVDIRQIKLIKDKLAITVAPSQSVEIIATVDNNGLLANCEQQLDSLSRDQLLSPVSSPECFADFSEEEEYIVVDEAEIVEIDEEEQSSEEH